MLRILPALLTLGAAFAAEAAIFPVGTGTGCGYASVQAAVDHAQTYEGATPDVIRISRTLAYSAQAIKVGDQTVEIVGGFDDCLDSTPSGTTTLSGAGGGSDSVIQIQGNGRVVLRHLTVSGGDEPDGSYGGGIDFRGDGVLEIRDSSVINNRAGHGGGIYAVGTGPNAELIVGANVTISANVATRAGGGALVEGLEMTMIEPGSVFAFNQALGLDGLGEGGGLLLRSTVERPGHAYIGSPGQGGLGAFYANQARYGGAIAVNGGNDSWQDVELQLFSVSARAPLALRENAASVGGGALYARDDVQFSSSSHAYMYASHVVLDRNRAPQGSAAYLDYEDSVGNYPFGGYLSFKRRTTLGEHPASIGCPTGQPCARIVGNEARDAGGQATDGATVFGLTNSYFDAERLEMSGNRGGRLIHIDGDNTNGVVRVQDSLLVRNQTTHELVRVDGGDEPELTVERSTIADNTIGAAHVLSGADAVTFDDLLVHQPGKLTLGPGADSVVVHDVLASEVASIGGSHETVQAAPRFVDPARSDYRLRAASAAVDAAVPEPGDDRDLLGAPRDQDVELNTDGRGVRDIGAFERPTLQPLVLNNQFHDDLNLWPVNGGAAGWDGMHDATGSIASGSARVFKQNPSQPRVFGATHCVHLPGPGRYALNGYGRAAANPIGSRDQVLLNWEFRSDGGEACNAGIATRGGDHLLATLEAWNRPANPAVIEVTAAEWTRNSSINIALVVVDVGVQVQPQVLGWFDAITLEPAAPAAGPLLRDGFEG
jgi:hypothetical protein